MIATIQRPHPEAVAGLYSSDFSRSYDVRADVWDRTLAWRARAQLRERLRQLPDRPLRVLDVGCGTGRNLSLLRSVGAQIGSYRGIDRSPRMLSMIDTDLLPAHHSLDIVDLDAPSPFASDNNTRTYDLVICTWVLSHLRHCDELLDEMLDAAAPDGRVLIAAATRTDRPIGTLLERRYRQLHAWPIDGSAVCDRDPLFVADGLFGLTTVAEWAGTEVAISDDSNIVSSLTT